MRTLRAANVPFAVCVLALAPLCSQAEDQTRPSNTLRLGISTTLFQGMPEPLVIAVMKPFEGLLIQQTGMNGELLPSGDGASVVQALTDGRLDVGVLEGIEFAWERQRHPELRPLMITINEENCLHACVVVPRNSPARRVAD